ncbi:hypothetical protein Rsub_02963 [Raphidocelis subcapitata]|uniref:Uncharacterized protein n=1 Tax=Raphidocelis subcapitata TaxID=307507 RepID=A0A2V0NW61_9CHLO|nr:hypothetical protein Rsub_02963 [Raphidocelis subcapitata]|eukprot:GBF89793.1 hypothetical protein Rsub_02963 [Raphidocelis subcapitata]
MTSAIKGTLAAAAQAAAGQQGGAAARAPAAVEAGGTLPKPRGEPPAVVDRTGVRYPANFFVSRRKPVLVGVLPVGTADVAGPDDKPRPGHSKLGPPGGATKGWGKRSDRRGSNRGNKRR